MSEETQTLPLPEEAPRKPKEKLIEITLPAFPGVADEVVIVNDVKYELKRGETHRVPQVVVDVLKQAGRF